MSSAVGMPPSVTGPRGRELLRAVAEGTAGAVGDQFLRSLVRSLAEALGAKLAFVAEATRPDGGHVRLLSAWYDGAPMEEPFEYDTEGQPCAMLPRRPVVAVPESLTARFPQDTAAIEMGLESYLAVCLRASDGTHLGHIAVLDTGPLEAGDDEIAALRIFASGAAAELERRRQAAALAASRARLVEAADAERRRVGRDLHDGAQQRLMAVSNLLKVARRRLGEDGAAHADGLLDMAARELDEAHAELRNLARGLHPVALAERGLPGALESLAAGSTVPVELEVADGAALPERVATAAYFVVAESLANATKYARASTIRVRADVDGDHDRDGAALIVEVADDGVGGADVAAGTGLCGLSDRVEGLGGRLEVASPAGA
ncbi:MAG TPA: histidine kinase, partial [Solirubrobacteraceae bacterium]|nr:histidine kinase [Solirubrobacteraceae bacterium]